MPATARDVQERLRALDFYHGKIDGDFGEVSSAAALAALAGVQPLVVPALSEFSGEMRMSPAGRATLAQREGNKLRAYQDTKGVWTIGVGHTAAAGAPAPARGMTITTAESDAILSRDLALFEAAVRGAVKVPVKQHEFDAMVSLAFNIGGGGFKGSSVVKRLNAGDRPGAANAFLLWNKPPEIRGRRAGERLQFLGA